MDALRLLQRRNAVAILCKNVAAPRFNEPPDARKVAAGGRVVQHGVTELVELIQGLGLAVEDELHHGKVAASRRLLERCAPLPTVTVGV